VEGWHGVLVLYQPTLLLLLLIALWEMLQAGCTFCCSFSWLSESFVLQFDVPT
jgi:hypothetical protein